MAADTSTRVFELFSGKKRTRLLPTLAIAVLVTSVVAVPLVLLAIDNRNNPVEREVIVAPADAQLVMVDTAVSDPEPLDLATVEGSVLISLHEQTASAVSFNLFAAGADEAIIESQDLAGPQFDFLVRESGGGSPLDTSLLLNGDYELFVTIRTADEDRRTAVSFSVVNP